MHTTKPYICSKCESYTEILRNVLEKRIKQMILKVRDANADKGDSKVNFIQ